MSAKNTFEWRYPRLIAHRGGGYLAPENTLAAMRCGHEYGFSMVEFDVKLSQDNMLVLMHDDTVDRTSNGIGLAASKTFRELSELDFGGWHSAFYTGEPIPTFVSVARFTQENNIFCNIEIKPCPNRETETGTLVAKAAKQWWLHSHLPPLLSSFSLEALAAAKQAAPELPRAFLTEDLPDNFTVILEELDCVAINLKQSLLDQEKIERIHQAGYKVCAWTVNDYQRAKQLLHWGCDALFTDELLRVTPDLA
ncbi:MAG: glycerophosphodiester phosphodiesterase [Advenella sp.]